MAGPMVGESDTIWIGNGDGYVAQVTRIDGLEPIDWADATLIAAAPDLLAALRLTVDTLSPPRNAEETAAIAAARAALRKAGAA
jgi:hypothetical protein